jgi:hypothetical protein
LYVGGLGQTYAGSVSGGVEEDLLIFYLIAGGRRPAAETGAS